MYVRCRLIHHFDFYYISLIISDVEHLFMYLFGHLHVFFGKMSVQVLFNFFFNWILWVFDIEFDDEAVFFCSPVSVARTSVDTSRFSAAVFWHPVSNFRVIEKQSMRSLFLGWYGFLINSETLMMAAF